MNRAVFALVAILILLSISSMTGLIRVVKADSGTITINADGSITPSSAPITTVDNITYTFTANIINESIVVQRDNIVLDGAGFTIQGNETGNGIDLSNRNNITIENANIENFDYGIYIGVVYLDNSSSDNTIRGNNITNNGGGVALMPASSNNTVSGNNITANNFEGIEVVSSSNNTLNGNTATANGSYGILLDNSSNNNTVDGNNATGNSCGIYLFSSSSNIVSENNVTANDVVGILLTDSSRNIVSGNNATADGFLGIKIYSSSNNNTVSMNIVGSNTYGFELGFSSNNTVSGNNVTANSCGIWLLSSSNNFIFHNNFVNNTNHVNSDGMANIWNNGSTGNYWSDYLTNYPNATQVDSSGVWNTPYVIDANNTDYYPLTVPIAVVPEFPSFLILPLFLIATLLAVIICKKKAMPYKRL